MLQMLQNVSNCNKSTIAKHANLGTRSTTRHAAQEGGEDRRNTGRVTRRSVSGLPASLCRLGGVACHHGSTFFSTVPRHFSRNSPPSLSALSAGKTDKKSASPKTKAEIFFCPRCL